MNKYIIKVNSITNGQWKSHYFQTIKENKNQEAMNVFVQCVTDKKENAMVFYDKEKANRFGKLFEVEVFSNYEIIKL